MASIRRLAAGGLTAALALAFTTLPAHAATKHLATATAKPVPAGLAKRATLLPPQIYQVNPSKVNPTVQPNIMILGQHLTPASTVQVGGRLATTVQAPDAYHLLVKLPDNLAQGSYSIEVTNEAGTAMATDQLVVDGSSSMPSTTLMLVGGGLVALLLLVMRLARSPSLA
jgi:hypothetical protein